YVAGAIYEMTGASRRHAQIVANILVRLRPATRGTPCQVYVNDVKVRAAHDIIYYPDVVVTCDANDTDEYLVNTPCLVVEVASPSTAMIDRREKLANYRRMDSL